MKRFFSLILCAVMVISLTACAKTEPTPTTEPTVATSTPPTEYTGFKVPNPMQHPNYSFDHTPTTDELRQMAVQAMRDILSVQWCVEEDKTYSRTVSGKEKVWKFKPETIYAGVPYTDAGSGLFQWLTYYDSNTGRLMFKGNNDMINSLLGNSCCTCVVWSMFSVCNSITGSLATQYMIPANGFLAVEPMTINPNITSYRDYMTSKVIADNGEDVVLQAYANTKAADGLISEDDDHAMMVGEDAHVEYTADGKIDPEKSYLLILDQRTWHNSKSGQVKVGDDTLHFSGRTGYQYTFAKLLKDCYIPVTTAEFLGTKPYEKPIAKLSASANTLEELLKCDVICNYNMSVIEVILTDPAGNDSRLGITVFRSGDVGTGLARKYQMNNFKSVLGSSLNKTLEAGKTYKVRVEVTAPNGEILVPAEITITK